MRVSAFVLAAVSFCLWATAARAQDKQTCNTAYQDAQVAKDGHKYLRAREQLRICASSSCPGFITKDCTEWLKDIDPRVPSVVFTAKNAAGADVSDVKVTMDGAPLADKLDGIAVDVDPGRHTFGFEGPDGKTEQTVVVPEGTKAQHIGVTFGAGGAPAVVATTPGIAATVATPAPASSGGFNALPPEPVDSGLSFSFRLGYGIPAGSIDGVNGASLSNAAAGQIPFWFDAGYLINPYFYVGAYLSYGVGTGVTLTDSSTGLNLCSETGVGCSSSDLRVGVDVQFRFLGKNKLQPWVGLGLLGYESTSGSASGSNGNSEGATFTGIEWVNPQLGFDYKFLPTLSAGPFVGVSISEFLGGSESATVNGNSGSQSVTITPKAIHEWIYIGARVNYDLHI
jgi:hypothetical protein